MPDVERQLRKVGQFCSQRLPADLPADKNGYQQAAHRERILARDEIQDAVQVEVHNLNPSDQVVGEYADDSQGAQQLLRFSNIFV